MVEGMRGLLLIAVALLGCDSRATTSDAATRAAAHSREYESCGSTADCADELHCFDQVCRRVARSTVGDYQVAIGAQAASRGDVEGAIAAYAKALAAYDAEKLALPPEIDCAYGTALAAGKAKKEHAELGARVLHRCILAVPGGSRLRDQALAQLAGLADSGFEPALLAANKLADLYLTRAPSKPSADKLAITVDANPVPTGKSYALIPEKLGSADVRPGLVACWEAYSAAAKKDALSVALGVKAAYVASEYEDEPGSFAVKLEPPSGLAAGSPDALADACVRQVVEPALKGLKIADAFATKLAITIK